MFEGMVSWLRLELKDEVQKAICKLAKIGIVCRLTRRHA